MDVHAWQKSDLLWQTRIITEVYIFCSIINTTSHPQTPIYSSGTKIEHKRWTRVWEEMVLVKMMMLGMLEHFTTKKTLPRWYLLVTLGHIFCHACTSMTILWHNQDSHTCAVVEVFHDITKIIITQVSTSMTINRASQKCFLKGDRHVASTVTERR